jgi:hypothetical protein
VTHSLWKVEQASCRTRVGGVGVTSLSPENPIIVLNYLMTTSSIFHSWLFASCFLPLWNERSNKIFLKRLSPDGLCDGAFALTS